MATSVNFTAKKRKVDEERRLFQERWTLEYFFLKNSDEKPCVLFAIKSLALPMSMIIRYYETNHSGSSYGKVHGDDRKQKMNQF